MKRLLLVLAPLALLAGCVVRTGPYVPVAQPVVVSQPPPRAEVYYYGQHFIPDEYGGGWCYVDGPHSHEYYPDRSDWYEQDGGYFYYRGPFEFGYYTGHPLPGGGRLGRKGPW
jgi:hypothetical protein